MDTGGAVYPRQDCPHVWMKGSMNLNKIEELLASNRTIFQETGCASCRSKEENWLCLSCGNVQCSRYVQGHSEEHWMQTLMAVSESGPPDVCSHCLVLSMSDLSIWCYCCNQYIKHEIFTPILVKAEASKFQVPEKLHLLEGVKKHFPVGIVFVPMQLSEKHSHATGCYERPVRLEAIYTVLENKNLLTKLYSIEPVYASENTLGHVHSPEYIARIKRTAETGDSGAAARAALASQGDLYATSSTYELACYAAGSVVALTERVCTGSVQRGFALVRPPGHHAERSSGGGFCFFNNIAIAAQVALSQHGLTRVMIVDFDIHHGNGCQNVFYDSNKVLHVSIHKQFHHIPITTSSTSSGSKDINTSSSSITRTSDTGSMERAEGNEEGRVEYIGSGEGTGFNVNIPLGPGYEGVGLGDADYFAVFEEIVTPLAQEFQPELIFIPAGFDAGIHDRNLVVGGYSVSSKGFAELVRRLMSLSPGGRVVAALEGGYECRGVAESVAAVIEAMLDYEDYHDKKDASADSPLSKSDGMSASIHPHTLSTILDAKSKLATTWKCFQTK